MPQTIVKGFRQLVDEALAQIKTLQPAEAIDLHGRADVVFVDLRDPREQEREGVVPGAISCTRGMLEFWIDPASPYFKPVFAEDKSFVFFGTHGAFSITLLNSSPRSTPESSHRSIHLGSTSVGVKRVGWSVTAAEPSEPAFSQDVSLSRAIGGSPYDTIGSAPDAVGVHKPRRCRRSYSAAPAGLTSLRTRAAPGLRRCM